VSATFSKKIPKLSLLPSNQDQWKKYKTSGVTPKKIYSMPNSFKESRISDKIKLRPFLKRTL